MKKLLMVALLGLVSAWGVAQAESDGGRDYIGEYYESIPRGSPTTIMMLRARICYNEALYLMMGADFNERGAPYDDVVESLGFDEEERALIKEGFKYKDAFDPRISQQFAKCLVDAHKNIGK